MSFTIKSDIVSLEHVVVVFSMHFIQASNYYHYHRHGSSHWDSDYRGKKPRRGTVKMSLTSPSGTTSTLLPLRPGDVSSEGYKRWPLMSLHFWGESPSGMWTVGVAYTGRVGKVRVEIRSLVLYGTSKVPKAVSRIPAQCSEECDSTRGCAASGEEFCDSCAQLCVSSTLECTDACPQGLSKRNGYCYDSSQDEASCGDSPSASSSTSYPPSVNPTSTVPPPSGSHTIYPTPTTAPDTPTDTPGKRGAAVPGTETSSLLVLSLMITALSLRA